MSTTISKALLVGDAAHRATALPSAEMNLSEEAENQPVYARLPEHRTLLRIVGRLLSRVAGCWAIGQSLWVASSFTL